MPDMRKSFLVLVLLGLLAVTACGVGVKPVPTLSHDFATTTPDAGYPTAMPTFTPTPAALGSVENPIVIALVDPSPSAEQQAAFNDLASLLGGHLQLAVVGRYFNTYLELEFALQRQQVQFAWLQPIEYLLASQKGLATALLVTNHLGVTGYGVQFLGHQDSNFKTYFNVGTHSSTAEAKIALAQLSGLRGCLTEDNSLGSVGLPQDKQHSNLGTGSDLLLQCRHSRPLHKRHLQFCRHLCHCSRPTNVLRGHHGHPCSD